MEVLAASDHSLATPFPTGCHILPRRASSVSILHRRSPQGCRSDAQTFFRPASTIDSRPVRRPTNCTFLPLPPIIASPVCTPTTGMSSRAPSLDSDSDRDKEFSSGSTEDFTTASTTPSDESPITFNLSTPTWISTPPTPPQKLVRRSVTCMTRRGSSPLVSPSASFPASVSPHAQCSSRYPSKRRASIPPMSPRPRASSDSSATLRRPRTGLAKHEAKWSATPLRAAFFRFGNVDATANEFSAAHPRPLFHVPHQVSTDIEDSDRNLVDRSNDETSMDGSSSVHSLDDGWCREKQKDDVRKYHALMELLTTEVGYLLDLRALVTIYLRNLPTLTCRMPSSASSFVRSPPSFTSNLVTHFHPHALTLSGTLADGQAPNAGHAKEKDRGPSRCLFTDAEIELLTRNAEEVLQLHEHFVQELQAVMAPLDFSMLPHEATRDTEMQQGAEIETIDAAISAVSAKFATEASRFNSYQTFCTGHPEALTIVRRVQLQYPAEWDAFEQQCSTLVSDALEADLQLDNNNNGGIETCQPAPHQGREPTPSHDTLASKEYKRTTSLTSTDVAVRSLRSRANGGSKDFLLPFDVRKDKGSRRLAFMDYMIKPVQRICKYPLLLDQLKPGKSVRALSASHPIVRSDVNVVVESAMQAMRHVASSVDEARHRQDVAIQSSLIVSRISLANPTSSGSYLSSVHPAFQVLTPTFLSSLGTCLLAGSLDVMHCESFKASGNSPSINAKYLGAFLYMGGYFVLVKVCKGKVYEPRHWFSLVDFDIVDVTGDDAMLPCSFRLLCKGHQFELAAACQREKDAWMSAIQECLKHPPHWTNEPTSSLQFDGKGELIASALDDGPFEAINALPTIQSIPELAGNADCSELTESLLAALQADTKQNKSKHDMSLKSDAPVPPSRRSSTASVKAIFSPMSADSDTIVIRRSSSIARSQVDQGLQDVISEPCLTARSHASSREEELFQAPKITRSGFARSNSGLSMAGMTKNRLRRHESVRVPRRKSLLDRPDGIPVMRSMPRRTSLASRRHTKKLSICSTSDGEVNLFVPDSDPSSYSPSPFSRCSTTTSSPASSPASPTHDSAVFPGGPVPETDPHEKATRSLVNNMKGLFLSRQTSPVSSCSQQSIPDVEHQWKQTLTPGLLKRWTKVPLHRRARSAPEVPKLLAPKLAVPTDETNVVDPRGSHVQLKPEFGASLSIRHSTEAAIPAKRRSLLPTSMYRYTTETDVTPRPVQKNFPLLQRLKAIDII